MPTSVGRRLLVLGAACSPQGEGIASSVAVFGMQLRFLGVLRLRAHGHVLAYRRATLRMAPVQAQKLRARRSSRQKSERCRHNQKVRGLTARSGRSGQESSLADAVRTVRRNVVPPSSLNPCLLTWRRNPRALRPVAPRAGGDEVLQVGGATLGPRVEVVTVLSGPRAPTPKAGLHLALAARPCHTVPALLATETPDGVPSSDIAGVDDDRNNGRNNDQQPRECSCSQHAVNKAA